MPEIRATLTEELHRKLKSEAAQEGKHLKVLIAQVLAEHVGGNGTEKKENKPSST